MGLAFDRRGAGEPLVLVHGTASYRGVWNPIVDALAAEREVIALDLPGFGRSAPLPPGRAPTVRALAGAVAGLLDELGLDAAHVAGNSLGGGVALELAAMGRTRSAVGLSPIGFGTAAERAWTRGLLRFARAGAKALDPLAPSLVQSAAGRRLLAGAFYSRPDRLVPDDLLEGLRNFTGCPGFDATVSSALHEALVEPARIEVPVTILWGTRDAVHPPWQAQRVPAVLPKARLEILEGAGHVPMHDDPEASARVILETSA
jgi:pimeloyl-ACP methyl ester carboxylesterase